MTILVVSTGNHIAQYHCRMLTRSELSDDISIESAGYPCKRVGIRPLPAVREVMREVGLDVSNHRARRVMEEMINRSDLILVMTRRKKESLREAFPKAKTKCT